MSEIILDINIYTTALEPGEKILLISDGSIKCGDVVMRYPSRNYLREKFSFITEKGYENLTSVRKKDVPDIILQMDEAKTDRILREELLKIHDENIVSDVKDKLLDKFAGYVENKWHKKLTAQNVNSFRSIEKERGERINRLINQQN